MVAAVKLSFDQVRHLGVEDCCEKMDLTRARRIADEVGYLTNEPIGDPGNPKSCCGSSAHPCDTSWSWRKGTGGNRSSPWRIIRSAFPRRASIYEELHTPVSNGGVTGRGQDAGLALPRQARCRCKQGRRAVAWLSGPLRRP